MKKILKNFTFGFAVLFVGTIAVFAATKTIYTSSKYSINAGGSTIITGLSGTYAYAKGDATVDGVTSGTSTTTVFKAYINNSGVTTLKATKSLSLTRYSSRLFTIGYVGSGTWIINNNAFSGSTKYAGWNGSLKYISSSTS